MFFCGGVIECAFQEVNSNIILYWKCTSKYHPICCFDYLQHHHDMVGYIHYLPAWVLYVRLYSISWYSRWRLKRSIEVQDLWQTWSLTSMSQRKILWAIQSWSFVQHLLPICSDSKVKVRCAPLQARRPPSVGFIAYSSASQQTLECLASKLR